MNHQAGLPDLSGAEEYQRLVSLLDERRFDEALVRGQFLLEQAQTGLLVRAKTHNLVCWTYIEGLKRPAPEAVLHGEEGLRLFTALGERSLSVQAMANLASAAFQMADLDMASSLYHQMLQVLEGEPSLLLCGSVLAHMGLAQVALVQGRPSEALRYLALAELNAQEPEARFLVNDICRRRALVYLRLCQPNEAAAELTRIDEAAVCAGPRSLWWKTHLMFTRARVELSLGHWVTARELATNSVALARELGDLPVLAEASCTLALAEAAEGRKEAGRRARSSLSHAIHSGRRDLVDDLRERLKDLLASELS